MIRFVQIGYRETGRCPYSRFMTSHREPEGHPPHESPDHDPSAWLGGTAHGDEPATEKGAGDVATEARFSGTAFDVVGLLASAGGLRAVSEIVGSLPPDFPAAILLVQHLDRRHRSLMADILGRRSALPTRQAVDGDKLEPGTIYLAPPDYHLLANPDGSLSLSHSALVHFVRPSGDLLFESLAGSYGSRVIAVVLTGSGFDGTMGVRAVKQMGGTVIVEDPAEAEFPSMPKAAIDSGAVDFVLPLADIGPALCRLVAEEDVT